MTTAALELPCVRRLEKVLCSVGGEWRDWLRGRNVEAAEEAVLDTNKQTARGKAAMRRTSEDTQTLLCTTTIDAI